jgi:hypothetical protein
MQQVFRKMIVWSTIVILLLIVEGFATNVIACTFYASPSGGGNGLSPSAPFKIANFWAVAGPGKTLCLLDGQYTDSTSMIKPPQNLNGTSTQKITIKALNDGQVRINGQGARRPVELTNNDHFVLEGFDAHNSIGSVIKIGTGADNNIVRRVCAWDSASIEGSGHEVLVWQNGSQGNTGNVYEDVCGFGRGRKIFASISGHKVTYRRAWGMWETNQIGTSPESVFNMGYVHDDSLVENSIGTWRGTSGESKNPRAIFTTMMHGTNHRYYGSIAYVLSSVLYQPGVLADTYDMSTANGGKNGVSFYKDVVIYSEQSSKRPILFRTCGATAGDCRADNITLIGGSPSSFNASWAVSNRVELDSIAKMNATGANPFQAGSGAGARVCKQYVNGTLTSTPLWPWPMNQRIIDAMKAAGKLPVDVTKTMEQIFGPIPSECRSTGEPSGSNTPSTFIPASPTSLRAQSN